MNRWLVALLASTLAAALAAACGSSSPKPFDQGGDDGGADGSFPPGIDAAFNATDAARDTSVQPLPDCDPTCQAAGGQCVNKVCTIGDNTGGVDPGTIGKLGQGGSADAAFKLVYPYDKTVFPRGLLPPTLQLAGAAPDAALVHVTAAGLDYKGYFGRSSPGRIVFTPAVWRAITIAARAQDAVKVEVTKISAGQVTGPISQTWNIAQGSLRGTIYYETYDSQLIGGLGAVGVLKIQPGAAQPTPMLSGCGNTCHTVSADGSTLVAGLGFAGMTSASYDLRNNAAQLSTVQSTAYVYGGLYPDGRFLMSATSYRTWTNLKSSLYDTRTGAVIAAPGWDNVVTNAATPAFSPDGKKIVWNREDTGQGHTLSVMDFDASSRTFSNLTDIVTDPASFLGWPAFTPDTKSFVYHAGSNAQFETNANAEGDLKIADIASKTVTRLDLLDGYGNGSATSYLPANDPKLNFAPTVLPEAVGGYFWVVFTSHRSYGNTLPSKQNNDTNGKLWVAAIDINGAPGADPSHPAFYLDGQEQNADNLRGFWVLDPCKANGGDCRSGDECCAGYCRPGGSGGLVCVPPPGGCSQEFEKCTSGSDCCDATNLCINGRCARRPPR